MKIHHLLLAAFLTTSPLAHGRCNDQCGTNYNTYQGTNALEAIMTHNGAGYSNTATGEDALMSDSEGFHNTATGHRALASNTTGDCNNAFGAYALENNNGAGNNALGDSALRFNVKGTNNTALGSMSLAYNNADHNTAVGWNTLFYNITGSQNTAVGANALYSNSAGTSNLAVGSGALYNNTGSNNIAVGIEAGVKLTRGNYNIEIGNEGATNDSNVIRIGSHSRQTTAYIQGIYGVSVDSLTATGVIIDSSGRLGILSSSASNTEQVKPIGAGSKRVLALEPVTYHDKADPNSSKVAQFGLIAEQVEKVAPELVIHEEQGKPFSVRYEAVNAMLLNEFLKEHRKVDQLSEALAQQQKEIDALKTDQRKQSAQFRKLNR
ncbi:MAG TPA: tail fiber domain-containing protein [Chthoniobacterales bacterium]|jgi:hypothetical protein